MKRKLTPKLALVFLLFAAALLTAVGLLSYICLAVGRKILDTLSEPVRLEGEWLRFGASIGVSIFPDTAEDIESLIKYADLALYSAKQQRGEVRFYRHEAQT